MLKSNPISYLFLKLWHYSEGRRKQTAIYMVMSWFANLAHLCIPLTFALILNEVQKNGVTERNFPYLVFLTSLFIFRSLVTWALHGPSRYMEESNAFLNRARYKTHLFGGVLRLPLAWHAEHHTGDSTDKMEKGPSGLGGYTSNSFRVIGILNSLAISFFVLLFFSRGAGLIALAMMVLGSVYLLISAGREDYVKKGKDTMIQAAVGLLIVFLAYSIALIFPSTPLTPNPPGTIMP